MFMTIEMPPELKELEDAANEMGAALTRLRASRATVVRVVEMARARGERGIGTATDGMRLAENLGVAIAALEKTL